MRNSNNWRERIKKEATNELARRDLLYFVNKTFDKYDTTPFHVNYAKVLDHFAKGDIKRLIITVPPQTGKSQLSTRHLPSFLLGRNPNLRIAIASYNSTFARKFNRDIQRIIDSQEYYEVFPKTLLNDSNVVTVSDSFLRNSEEFEIVGHKGSLKAVGRGGALTGNPVDIMIMDDLYKDYEEGNSPIIRESVWNWYTSVVKTRLHNDSQELIVFTRWHEDDLIGRLEKHPDEKIIEITSLEEIKNISRNDWVKINFEAIKVGEKTPLDDREKGEALYPQKHSIEKLLATKRLDPEQFECLYQGNPISAAGLLYQPFNTYNTLPDLKMIKNYTDTADAGDNMLCSICYGTTKEGKIYILDVVYTDEGMEKTEGYVANMLIRNNVNVADIESNNGGQSFARQVDALTPGRITVKKFHQSKNKESRIVSNSATVVNLVLMPSDWKSRWPLFYEHITRFKKNFSANKYDDAPDALTGVVEKYEGDSSIGIIW